MNDILKQRLVGALVLIALGVLFWPVIFVEPQRSTMDRDSQIAPMPRLDDAEIPAPEPLRNVPSVASADKLREAAARDDVVSTTRPLTKNSKTADTPPTSAPTSAEDLKETNPERPAPAPEKKPPPAQAVSESPADTADKTPPTSPSLDEQGIPIAWVLQVAALSTRDKADALTADLIAQGYKAYHRAVQRNDGLRYRVFVGPVFERDKLKSIKQKVDSRLKVNTIITRYLP